MSGRAAHSTPTEPPQGTALPVQQRAAEPQVALVVGGGAVKAYAFHVGVTLGLEDDGFFFRSGLRWEPRVAPPGVREIQMYVGSSAGACIVAGLVSGHPPGTLRDAVLGQAKTVPTFGYRTLFVPVAPNPRKYLGRLIRRLRLGHLRPHHLLDIGGLMTTAGVEKYFRRELPTNRFSDLAVDLFIAATQVNSSRKVVFGPTDSLTRGGYDRSCAYYNNVPISQAVAAAVAVPPLFAPYAITNATSGKRFHYYDGEVRDPLSAHVARDAGADFVVASSIWRPYSYDDRVGTLADFGMSTLVEQALHQSVGEKVDREREQTRLYDELLLLLERHASETGLPRDAVETLKMRVRELLRHRSAQTLYVVPEERDHAFFFEGSFRFNRRLIERCIAAGHRAYRAAARNNPAFFTALDGALSTMHSHVDS